MKTSLRLLVVSAALAATASVYAGEGAANRAQRTMPTARQAHVTAPVTTKAAAENTAPRAYERGVKLAVPAETAPCCRQS